jgi:hypothetical protein
LARSNKKRAVQSLDDACFVGVSVDITRDLPKNPEQLRGSSHQSMVSWVAAMGGAKHPFPGGCAFTNGFPVFLLTHWFYTAVHFYSPVCSKVSFDADLLASGGGKSQDLRWVSGGLSAESACTSARKKK